MDDKGILALLNPTIALLFSLTFLVFWSRQRQRRYILAFAAAYFLSSIGFFNSYLVDLSLHVQRTIISNGSYLAGALLMAWGLCRRADVAMPKIVLGVFALCGATGAMWFATVDPDIAGRLYSVNFALGGMFVTVALSLRHQTAPAITDRLLLWVVLLTGVQFFLRTSVTLHFDTGVTAATYLQSYYWAVLSFFVSLFSLLMALTIIAAVANDIMQKIANDADIDPLTGLPNRRGFERTAGKALNVPRAQSVPVCLLVVDIDHFKTVNDRYGHPAGDCVIRGLGDLISGALDGKHVASRFGGEEFCILLENTDLASARLFAEGIRTMVEQCRFDQLPSREKVTVSIGVAERRSGQNFEELYRLADRALYQAKDGGRNRVRTAAPYFTPSSPPLNVTRVASGH